VAPAGTSPFFRRALLGLLRRGISGLQYEQKTIADFWSDGAGATGTPPGHWIAIVSQIARKDVLSLAEAAEAYSRVGIALHDAFIGSWNTKYTYNLLRPVTYVNGNIDVNWMPYIVTPNFPSYPSGHSMQSSAAAYVLTEMFGVKQFTDTTHIDHGLVPSPKPRTFNSFYEAAAEAAVSRLYGGIHFSFDNDDGLASGECIGRTIHERANFKLGDHVLRESF
jgi:membrane-associated phospholipid phosphatase